MCILERETGKDHERREIEILPSTGLLPICVQQSGLGQARFASEQPLPDLPHGRGPKTLSGSSQAISREASCSGAAGIQLAPK